LSNKTPFIVKYFGLFSGAPILASLGQSVNGFDWLWWYWMEW